MVFERARERADANFAEMARMAKMVKISRAEGALEPKPILKVSDPCRFQNVSNLKRPKILGVDHHQKAVLPERSVRRSERSEHLSELVFVTKCV